MMVEDASNCNELSLCSEAVASKPETGQNQPCEWERSKFNGRDQPASLTQRIMRYMDMTIALHIR